MQSIHVSAPGKLMLFGEYAVLEGEPCLTAAVNHRMYATITKNKTNQFILDAKDLGVFHYTKSMDAIGTGDILKDEKFAEIAAYNFFTQFPEKKSGVSIETAASFSKNFGFGSSAATTAAIIFALSELFVMHLSKKQVFDLAYKTVMDVQKKGSGFDVASSVYGGVLQFVIGGKSIEPLNIQNTPLLVGYIGKKADTVTFINTFSELKKNNPIVVKKTCSAIGKIVAQAKNAMEQSDWKTVGRLMQENQQLLNTFNVSTPTLDQLMSATEKNGAYGAKISGAGGGDCMIALAPEEKKDVVIETIKNNGGAMIDVAVEMEGVRIEK